MGVYVCYYDCTGWQSEVEVMNLQGRKATYRLAVYDRTGAPLFDEERTLAGHQTERIYLNERVNGQEGKIVIMPADDEDDEFPAVLTIADEGRDFRQANRYVPFIRLDEIENDDDDDNDEADDQE
jgi:hypothetical protein